MSRIICIGMSPSVLIASLFGSGLMKYNVGSPRTWERIISVSRQLCKFWTDSHIYLQNMWWEQGVLINLKYAHEWRGRKQIFFFIIGSSSFEIDQILIQSRRVVSGCTCISRANSYSSSVSTFTISALLSYSTASCQMKLQLYYRIILQTKITYLSSEIVSLKQLVLIRTILTLGKDNLVCVARYHWPPSRTTSNGPQLRIKKHVSNQ